MQIADLHSVTDYSRDVMDNPKWTREDIAKAMPFGEAFPELAIALRERNEPRKWPRKLLISLLREVVEKYMEGGPGWQSLVDADLRGLIKTGWEAGDARSRDMLSPFGTRR